MFYMSLLAPVDTQYDMRFAGRISQPFADTNPLRMMPAERTQPWLHLDLDLAARQPVDLPGSLDYIQTDTAWSSSNSKRVRC